MRVTCGLRIVDAIALRRFGFVLESGRLMGVRFGEDPPPAWGRTETGDPRRRAATLRSVADIRNRMAAVADLNQSLGPTRQVALTGQLRTYTRDPKSSRSAALSDMVPFANS